MGQYRIRHLHSITFATFQSRRILKRQNTLNRDLSVNLFSTPWTTQWRILRTLRIKLTRHPSWVLLLLEATLRALLNGTLDLPILTVTNYSLILIDRRLQSELMQLMLSPSPGISAFPNADGNLLSWTATIDGPADTPYENLVFKLSFAFPNNYPYAPPTVLFKTPIYHPNVDFSGRICLDILKDQWSAVYNVQNVLLSLQSLLGEPNKYASLFLGYFYFNTN